MSTQTRPNQVNESEQANNINSAQQKKARLCQIVHRTLEEQCENWNKLDFLDRSMVRKEFARYTGMSIEEMISKLTKLEEGIQRQSEITEFVEPLRKLVAYQRSALHYSKIQAMRYTGNDHTRLIEAEGLADMIVNDLQRMLFENITESYHEHVQGLLDIDERSSALQHRSGTNKEVRNPNLLRYL